MPNDTENRIAALCQQARERDVVEWQAAIDEGWCWCGFCGGSSRTCRECGDPSCCCDCEEMPDCEEYFDE